MGPYLLVCPIRELALTAPLVIAVGGFAQAACYNARQQLPTNALTQFMANPGQLQSKYPNGGARMISMVRDLVASDPAMLPRVLDLSANSNVDQINAIGTGLGQAALVCSRGDPAFANEIQQMVAAVNTQPLALSFAAVVGNSPPAAVPAARGVRSGANAGSAQSSTVNPGLTSPADPPTGQPGSPFPPPSSPRTPALNASGTVPAAADAIGGTSPGATSPPTTPGTTATQGETSAVGIPTGTGSKSVTGSTGATTAGTTGTASVPGSLATTGTTATSTTGATTTGTTSSPAALTTVDGSVTRLIGAPTTGLGATSPPTTPGTTATQGETSAVGIPTGTGSTGVTGSTGATTTGTTGTASVPGSLATTGTTATSTTGATTTGTTSSPAALTTVDGSVTRLIGAPTTDAANSTGVTGTLAAIPIGTTATGAPSGISSTTPTSAIAPTGTTATGTAGTASTTSTSPTIQAGTTTAFSGSSLTLSQTAVAPTSFFTLDFTASGQPVRGGTNGAPRSVSPSQ